MREAVIVSSVRTAVGKAGKGTLRATRPDDLAAVAIKGAIERAKGLDAAESEDVIVGLRDRAAALMDQRVADRKILEVAAVVGDAHRVSSAP